jgi:exopolyphosphatase / guanosine-5'-triphosphate,3'-diphosphate pyrophosphatase
VKIAAIDIGSNALRLFIADAKKEKKEILLEKLLHTRVPVRLGEDVFTFGKISREKLDQLILVLKGFDLIIQSLGVENKRICATSAVRSAENRDEVVKRVKQECNLNLEILSGEREAQMIFSNFHFYDLPKEGNYIFIDVGGGSTEITIIEKGDKKDSQSFEIGTVRMLLNEQSKLPKAIFSWLNQKLNKNLIYKAIGTGGNINSAIKILEKKQRELVSVEELKSIMKTMSKLSKEQRMKKYKLRSDRADVIIPALNIYTQIAEYAGVIDLLAPKFGLADGIVLEELSKFNIQHLKFISS